MITCEITFNKHEMSVNGIEIEIEAGSQFPYYRVGDQIFYEIEQAIACCLEQTQ